MAKLSLTLDTESNALAVTVDGEAIANVSSVSVYNYDGDDGEVHFEVCTREKVGDHYRNTHLMASDLTPAQAAIAEMWSRRCK